MFANEHPEIAKLCLQNDLHLLKAKVRHLGTDINYIVLENLYQHLHEHVDFQFHTSVESIQKKRKAFLSQARKGNTLRSK